MYIIEHNLDGGYYYNPIIDEETDSRSLSHLPKLS
jgi:hypothetical protein